jgi:hypothetical protein
MPSDSRARFLQAEAPRSAPAQLGGDGATAGGDPAFSPRGPSTEVRPEPQHAAPARQPPTAGGAHFGALLA